MNKVTEESIQSRTALKDTQKINTFLYHTGGKNHGFNKSFISSKE